MRHITSRLLVPSLVTAVAAVAAVAVNAAPPAPPLKPGLWETRSAVLDANGKETVPPEQAALANMPPETRARMAEMMKGRGVSMPDASGAMKVCLTRDLLESGRFQQMAADTGCTTTYSTQTTSNWKWHSTCPALKSESDGEAVFTNSENYRSTMKSTVTVNGRTESQTRVITSKWLGADCGDVKPLDPNMLSGARGARPPR